MDSILPGLLVAYGLCSLLALPTDACMKTEEPMPQSTTPTVVTVETTTLAGSRKKNCTSSADEYYEKCLNGGYCMKEINIVDNSSRSYCRCREGYTSTLCEQSVRKPDPSGITEVNCTETSSVVKESHPMYAAVGVAVVMLIIVVVSIIAIIKIRRDRARGTTERSDSPGSPNGLSNAGPTAQFSLYSSPPPQNGEVAPNQRALLEGEDSV